VVSSNKRNGFTVYKRDYMEKAEDLRKTIKMGHGIAKMLAAHGVKYIFGIPDGDTLALYDGFLDTKEIQHILFNDERNAAFAADAYARVTGMLGVCDAGASGSLNFPVALAEAKGSASPVLALVGTVKLENMLRNIPHDIKVMEILSAVTKWTGSIFSSEQVPRFLSYAIRQAINGRPGPVAVVIPEDILKAQELNLKEFIPRLGGSCSINGCRPAPALSEIEYAVEMIRNAKQPVIFTGDGAVLSGCFSEVELLSSILKAPVFSTISGKGIMISRKDFSNSYFGTMGLFGEKPNNAFIRSIADLVIVVGNRLTEDDTANFKYPPQSKEMIQIDIDPAQIGLSYHPWGVIGDPQIALAQMIESLNSEGISALPEKDDIIKKRAQNMEELGDAHLRYREKDTATWVNSNPIKPQRILKVLSELMTANDYFITDASASSRWIGPYFLVKSVGRKIITPRGVGPTGFGLGALIGTCIAAEELKPPDAKVQKILLTGDGGIMNAGVSEFETIKKLNLDCLIIVLNNASLGFVKFGQHMLYQGRFYDTDRPNTNFAKISEAFGGIGFRVEALADLDKIMKAAWNCEGFRLVDVQTDSAELLPPNFY
jgi:acetolactate synthase-1/2/3 large subunit